MLVLDRMSDCFICMSQKCGTYRIICFSLEAEKNKAYFTPDDDADYDDTYLQT